MAQNKQLTVRTSSAITATGNTADLINRDFKGIVLVVAVTAASGTSPTMAVKVQGKGASGTYYDITGAVTASLTTTGTTILTVLPGVKQTTNVGISEPLPRVYRVVWTVGGTTPSFTTSIDGVLIA